MTRIMSKKLSCVSLILASVVGATACGDGEARKDSQLLVADTKRTAEDERIDKLMMMRVWLKPESKYVDYNLVGSLSLFLGVVSGYSNYSGNCTLTGADDNSRAHKDFVLAQAAMKIAESLASIDVDANFSIPPQDDPTRVLLYYMARRHARNAIAWALDILGDGTAPQRDNVDWLEASDWDCSADAQGVVRSHGATAVMILKQAAAIYRQATAGAARLSAAAGDFLRSQAASDNEGKLQQFAASEFSRSAAAHLLIGGEVGWQGSTSATPLCAANTLMPTEQRALEILRAAAPNPTVVLDKQIATETMLQSDVAGGSVKVRMANYLGRGDIYTSTQPLPEILKLTLNDFVAARNYLAQEIVAFSRSLTATLPTSASTGYINRYAGVATAPGTLEPVVSVAKTATPGLSYFDMINPAQTFEPSASSISSQAGGTPEGPSRWTEDAPLDQFDLSLAVQLRAVLGRFNAQRANWQSPASGSSLLNNKFQTDIIEPLSAELSTISDAYWGIVEYQRSDTNLVNIRIARRQGQPVQGQFWVLGEDGLRCAVDGTIEGAACSLTNTSLVPTPEPGYSDLADYISYLPSQRAVRYAVPTSSEKYVRYYLIEPSAKGNKAIFGFSVLAAGQPIAGKDIVRQVRYVRSDIVEDVAKFVSIDGNWCGESEYDCRGFRTGARLPLENELSDDNSGVESSWKHYVTLAQQAAAEAGLRGREYFEAGVEVEKRKEMVWENHEMRARAAIDTLQSACGTSADPRKLLDLLVTAGSSTPPSQVTNCTTNANCNSGGGTTYECFSGACVVNLAEFVKAKAGDDSDLRRIAECTSESTVIDFVSPGSIPLCLWTGTDQNRVCPDASDTGAPCPVKAAWDSEDEVYSCNSISLPAGYVRANTNVVMLDEGDSAANRPNKLLKYFDNNDPTPSNAQEICADFRKLRTLVEPATNSTANTDAITALQNKIKDSQMFYPPFMRETLEKPNGFGWRYLPESNAEFLLGSRVVYSTSRMGLEGQASHPLWPCSSQGTPPDCATLSGNRGLLCKVWDCSIPSQRLEAISRLRNATRLLNRLVEDPTKTGAEEQLLLGRDDYFAFTNKYFACAASDRTLSFYARGAMAPVTEELCTKPSQWFVGPSRIWHIDTSNAGDGRIWWGNEVNSGPFTAAEAQLRSDATYGRFLWIGAGTWLGTTVPPRTDLLETFGSNDDQYCPLFVNGLSHAAPFPPESCPEFANSRGHWTLRGFESIPTIRPDSIAWDGMEYYCQNKASGVPGCDPGSPPTVTSAADLPSVSRYMQCVGDSIKRRAGNAVFSRLPQKAVDALRKESAVGAFPALGGEYGAAVAQLRGALVDLADMPGAIATEVRQMSYDVDSIRATIEGNNLSKDLIDTQFTQTMAMSLASCAAGAASLMSGNVMSFAAGCASAMAEIGFASQIAKIQEKQVELKQITDIAQFQSMISQRARTLETYASRINEAVETMDSQLATVEGLRLKARRSLSDAVWSATYKAPNSDAINNSLSWKYEDARRSYNDATENALKYAIVARKSVEQRLGIRLRELRDDMPLVQAPAAWADDICRAKGVTFEEIKSTKTAEGESSASSGIPGSDRLLGTFVGDYVTKLANVVESYQIAFPFHEGTDEVVVSVRDDLTKTRAPCSKQSPNLIVDSDGLSALRGTSTGMGGWTVTGCPSKSNGNKINCVPIQDDVLLYGSDVAGSRAVQTYRLDLSLSGVTQAGLSTTGIVPKLMTSVVLQPGDYYLSYIDFVDGSCRVQPKILGPDGQALTTIARPFNGSSYSQTAFANIAQVDLLATARVAGTYSIAIGEATPGTCAAQTTPEARTTRIGGLMLQSVHEQPASTWGPIRRYVPSDKDGKAMSNTCEDTTGEYFRKNAWTRKSMRLCSDGFTTSCDENSGTVQWYREIRFRLDDTMIEVGEAFQGAGFALGNYNYRVEELGANFVGTGIRSCDISDTPSSCYGSGYVQYTLEHLGPFYVRNHFGQDVESLIFNGRIEHARGLATERFITNPLSSTDRGLIAPYIRSEFQGRPLSGEYVLRIWESPDVNLDRIQDIQLFMKYRYWSRQN